MRSSSARGLADHRAAPSSSKTSERAFERVAGGALLPVAAVHVAEDEERSGALERLLEPLVKHESPLELLIGRAEVAAGSAQKRAAAAGHDEDPGALERRPKPVEFGEQGFDLVQLAENDLRLDRVALKAEQRRLTESALFDRRREAAECPIRFACVSERELEEAENREQLETGRPAAQLVRQFQPLLDLCPCGLDESEVGIDERFDHERVGEVHCEPALQGCLARLTSVLPCLFPIAGQELDACEVEEDERQRVLVALVDRGSVERLEVGAGGAQLARPFQKHWPPGTTPLRLRWLIEALVTRKDWRFFQALLKGRRGELAAATECWQSVGYALVRFDRNRDAVRWLDDYAGREGVEPWALYNLASALRQLGRHDAALAVHRYAVALTTSDHATPAHALRVAVADALAGDVAAARAALDLATATAAEAPSDEEKALEELLGALLQEGRGVLALGRARRLAEDRPGVLTAATCGIEYWRTVAALARGHAPLLAVRAGLTAWSLRRPRHALLLVVGLYVVLKGVANLAR